MSINESTSIECFSTHFSISTMFMFCGKSWLTGRLKFRDCGKLYRDFCCERVKADLAIVGVGPAGLFGSFRAVENGFKNIVVIDKYPTMGGNCISYGCIPTKCLLKCSHTYHLMKKGFFALQGIVTSEPKLDLDQMMRTKAKVMKDLSDYMQNAFKAKGIRIIRGKATICGCNQLSVDGNDGKNSVVESDIILLATGSTFRPLPGVVIDEKRIVSSNGAMILQEVPKRMTVIGAGIIGLEMGSIWSDLGSEVTIISHDNSIVGPTLDRDIKKKYLKILQEQGLNFMFETKVVCASNCDNCVRYQTADKDGKNNKELECDVLMVAIGRMPYTEGLCLERAGIETNKGGFIPINRHYQTCNPNFYAVGDITPGPMTAHKAIEDVMDILNGKDVHIDFDHIPLAIYTHPEVACVGKNEDQLKKEGHPYRVSWSTFDTCARARTDLNKTGYIKALICTYTDRILGTHIIGAQAGEIINEVTVAQQYGLTAENLARVVHAHPTYAKMLKTTFLH
ncbi:dihydrolipoyl dehydrogenase, mitochondrial-like isoform X2 [Harmonia axyridis]|uniref:dihydrolipoyl dehydrogenase, mitochondrial-like isoform X2 n=1 Tax=Harmonia axyridis TaxID=115357 RepID=UPI001E276AB5|nr:dihydrolipoyl dehydrogenase, mitochondrial-like isoform X2 [Harmonia axyridis]